MGLRRSCHRQQEDFVFHLLNLVYFYRLLTFQICTIQTESYALISTCKRWKNKNQPCSSHGKRGTNKLKKITLFFSSTRKLSNSGRSQCYSSAVEYSYKYAVFKLMGASQTQSPQVKYQGQEIIGVEITLFQLMQNPLLTNSISLFFIVRRCYSFCRNMHGHFILFYSLRRFIIII